MLVFVPACVLFFASRRFFLRSQLKLQKGSVVIEGCVLVEKKKRESAKGRTRKKKKKKKRMGRVSQRAALSLF